MNDIENQNAIKAAQAANDLHANHEPVRDIIVQPDGTVHGRCGCGVVLATSAPEAPAKAVAEASEEKTVEPIARDGARRRVIVNDAKGGE